MEKNIKIKQKRGPKNFKFKRTKRLPPTFKIKEIVRFIIKCPGCINNQMIWLARNTCITINDCNLPINCEANIKILENKNLKNSEKWIKCSTGMGETYLMIGKYDEGIKIFE